MSVFNWLLGEPALSEFRLRKLLNSIEDVLNLPAANLQLEAHFVYFISTSAQPDPQTLERLSNLLHGRSEPPPGGDIECVVVPRLGTLSPWSSKATDIAKGCGLDQVQRIERGIHYALSGSGLTAELLGSVAAELHDRMTQSVLTDPLQGEQLFGHSSPRPLQSIERSFEALSAANQTLGLALSDDEVRYLVDAYGGLQRNPTDAELMMFAQANSEHCRHKIFNASWTLDGEEVEQSLFGMIRNTHAKSPDGVLSAYHDNSAVIEGFQAARLFPAVENGLYQFHSEPSGIQIKVETHNHPTAISPHPGAATGSGGEIRDEAATGRGAKPKAGLTGFTVSNLRIPGRALDWETHPGKPGRIVTALDIMLEGPIGGAAFNNEFGRPALGGYFRSFEQCVGGQWWGYHKPIMLAGGYGNIRPQHVEKHRLPVGAAVIVLGGPAMLIGLGGGAASSMGSGQSDEELDFASVQRENPEMERRCQEVIDACWSMGEDNPIISIHDVGAGGLSNALPELLNDSERGGRLELRNVPSGDPDMSPMEIWCNEAQERYVLSVSHEDLPLFETMCRRERCPFAVLGDALHERDLKVTDSLLGNAPVDVPLHVILGKPPKMHRDADRLQVVTEPLDLSQIELDAAAIRVMQHPTVGSKSFLITIGDRSVGGLVARDQMVGPWQVPVADAAVTLSGFTDYTGEAFAVGERSPLAIIDAPASGRMAVAESITNIASVPVANISDIKLSANWMAAAGEPGQDADLFDTVRAVGLELCPALGIAIPVGKDSLSLKTQWQDGADEQKVTAPVSLVVSAFAPVTDARKALTAQLDSDSQDQTLLLFDLGNAKDRLGGSILAQVYGQFGDDAPDLDEAGWLSGFFAAIQELNAAGLILAYHDRSDGGLLTTLSEMAFASRCGLTIQLPVGQRALLPRLFAEEPGAVIQIRESDLAKVRSVAAKHNIDELLVPLGKAEPGKALRISTPDDNEISLSLPALLKAWSETSHAVQRLRDNPVCADEELVGQTRWGEPDLEPRFEFPICPPAAPGVVTGARPTVAILREQGVNGQIEMAAGFSLAGFDAVDVHMSDLASGRRTLEEFQGLVACGGFSYGDVLGAGRGWAKSILFNALLRDQFEQFFNDTSRFALGVCNGCQALSALREIIPGAGHWPEFLRNRSEQFEARLSLVQIEASPSLFLAGMQGSRLPVVTAHGEGRVDFVRGIPDSDQIVMRYVNRDGSPATEYPQNPNGSDQGVTGVCNSDGRVTLMMPHPERTLRTVNFSWAPQSWEAESPWMRLFHNARAWVR